MDSPDSNSPFISHVEDDMPLKERKRVGFTTDATPPLPEQHVSSSQSRAEPEGYTTTPPADELLSPSNTLLPSPSQSRPTSVYEYPTRLRRESVSEHDLARSISMALGQPYVPKPKPAIRRAHHASPPDIELDSMVEAGPSGRRDTVEARATLDAHERASRLAARVGSYSAQISRRNSAEFSDADSPFTSGDRTAAATPIDTNKEAEGEESDDDVLYQKQLRRRPTLAETEAHKIVKNYQQPTSYYDVEDTPLHSGQVTPATEQRHFEAYVSPPPKYRGGILGQLLKLHNSDGLGALEAGLGGIGNTRPPHNRSTSAPVITFSEPPTPGLSPPASGSSTPTKKSSILNLLTSSSRTKSSGTLSSLVGSTSTIALPQKGFAEEVSERLKKEKRPGLHKRTRSGNTLASALQRLTHHQEYRITHIAETITRQRYLIKLCRALMLYGAPTHRLEEYMKYSARLLEINAQFLYIPGCMIMSFDDSSTHTAEVKLVRTTQGVDLGKLRDVHEIYKEVLHDEVGVEEAMQRLDDIMRKKPKHNKWFLVFMYGLASVTVGPFAFYARWIDLPMAFVLGALLGALQLVVAPKSDLYANVFEITAAVITSFLARAIGSIPNGKGGTLFCFSALAQSSIALILPGYTVLCASLELQSRQFVAGSVRMVYAIIYSLFLGFGITIGTVIFGLMDKNATSETQCPNPMAPGWYALFVPAFTMCLVIINQAKWKQAPVMLIISCCGYLVNYWVSRFVKGNTQVANTLGAFTIGAMANLYSRVGQKMENGMLDLWEYRLRPLLQRSMKRIPYPHLHRSSSNGEDTDKQEEEKAFTPRKRKLGHSLAAAAMLPAIFVQVPSGLAVSGSLVSGITSADQILSNTTGTTVVSNASEGTAINSTAFDVGYSVIQVAIGITVGLFLSALLVYPMGKKRSGLFSF